MTDRLTRFALLCLCTVPVWVILRKPWKRRIPREIALCLFIAYISALLTMALEGSWTTLAAMIASARSRLATMNKIYLMPLTTIRRQLNALPSDEALTQLLGNTLLFMPWGFFLPLLWKRLRPFLIITVMCLLLTCLIEGTQLFICRTVDVDDLILNFAGSMTGAGLWWMTHKICPAADRLAC